MGSQCIGISLVLSVVRCKMPGRAYSALDQGYISVTPLHLDLTNHRLLAEVEEWRLGG